MVSGRLGSLAFDGSSGPAIPAAAGEASNRSGSAKSTSSAIVAAPSSRSRPINRPTRSRRQGHCPMADRLRSSISTITIWPPGGSVPAQRTIESYALESTCLRTAGRQRARATVMMAEANPHRRASRRSTTRWERFKLTESADPPRLVRGLNRVTRMSASSESSASARWTW
jgi:hypothetical protein